MKTIFLFLLITPSLYARTVCRGYGNLNFSLDEEKKTFSFNQFCWNPCHVGEGLITKGPQVGWDGYRYTLDLTHSTELIAPFKTREMFLLLDFGKETGTLSTREEKIDLTCEQLEDF